MDAPDLLALLQSAVEDSLKASDAGAGTSTTAVLRYLPHGMTVRSLAEHLRKWGLMEGVDLVFIPFYPVTMAPMRIAVINFSDHIYFGLFAAVFHGFKLPGMHKAFAVGPAKIQGLQPNLEKILSWEFLHNDSLAPEIRPLLRLGGQCVSLPHYRPVAH